MSDIIKLSSVILRIKIFSQLFEKEQWVVAINFLFLHTYVFVLITSFLRGRRFNENFYKSCKNLRMFFEGLL